MRAEEVAAIAIDTYWVAKRFEDPASPLWSPTTHETAGNSIPYLVAAALVDGDVTEQSFDAGRLADPRLKELVKKTSIRESTAFNDLYPREWPCRIEITLKSGAIKMAETRYFKGHNKSPLSDAEAETKFRQLASPVLGKADIEKILASLWKLEEVGDIRTVLRWFAVTPG